jgi:short-subunit dehydrogenase
MSNKIVLITGANSGIGLATTKKLLNEGYTVYAGARDEESRKNIEEIGGQFVKIEMTDENTMIDAVDKIIEKEGKIDVLFNNAGYGLYGSVEEVLLEKARHQFEVNLFGLARLTQLVLPHMRKQQSGLIINTSSIGGKIYSPLGSWYHATKHALEGWSDCLRLEVSQFGIQVVIIEPGMIATNFEKVMTKALSKNMKLDAYKKLSNAVIEAGKTMTLGSSPHLIASVVLKSIKSSRPKTRYYAGAMAGMLLFVRKHFSDRFFDWFVMYQMKRILKNKI